uniref:Ig-like domain-containing protein n=1 Tax=Naja naja TaxID=35670 RepID=A0A8C6X4B4_NAJNA
IHLPKDELEILKHIKEHQFLSIKEGDSIHLKCSYLEAATNLQWYKQYPGGQPEFMIILYSSNTETKDNFEMTLNTNNKTTSFLKTTQLKDSAVYFCAIRHSGRKTLPGCLQR